MSYDIYLYVDTGGEEFFDVADGLNYTSNCGPMFRLAMDGIHFRDLVGRTAGDTIDILQRAVDHMKAPENKRQYESLNPPNGWGSHHGATKFMEEFLEQCRRHPKAEIGLWE